MKAVILAAGRGRRMLPLTLSVPKPLLRIADKPILDYIFESLPEEIDTVIVVVGYLKKKIQQYLGSRYQGKSIRYITQDILDGSASALLCCRDLFLPKERFLLVYGDELPEAGEITECLKFKYSWLCAPSPVPSQSGIALVNEGGYILKVLEKPEHPPSDLSAAGIMVINGDIFDCQPVQHSNGEYYLSSLMNEFLKVHQVRAVWGRGRPAFISPDEIEKLTTEQYRKINQI